MVWVMVIGDRGLLHSWEHESGGVDDDDNNDGFM